MLKVFVLFISMVVFSCFIEAAISLVRKPDYMAVVVGCVIFIFLGIFLGYCYRAGLGKFKRRFRKNIEADYEELAIPDPPIS